MSPQIWSSLILTLGGITFALVAVLAARSAFRSALDAPQLRGRVAELEARSEQHGREIKEALDVANKARRIASTRKEKTVKEEVAVERAAERLPPNGRPERRRDIFDAPFEIDRAPEERTDEQELVDLGDALEEVED